jgi:hypothetical protein
MMSKISALLLAAAALMPSAALAHPGHAAVAMAQSNASATLVLGGLAAVVLSRLIRVLRGATGNFRGSPAGA